MQAAQVIMSSHNTYTRSTQQNTVLHTSHACKTCHSAYDVNNNKGQFFRFLDIRWRRAAKLVIATSEKPAFKPREQRKERRIPAYSSSPHFLLPSLTQCARPIDVRPSLPLPPSACPSVVHSTPRPRSPATLLPPSPPYLSNS